MALSHENVPAIADLTVNEGRVLIEMRVNVEAQVSGIDLDAVSDTDEAENAADYDMLRALSGDGVAARAGDPLSTWNALPLLRADDADVVLTLDRVTVPEVPDDALPRVSELVLSGAVPVGVDSVLIAWPAGAGEFVLRQQGAQEPFTGLINGGSDSGPIAVAGGNAATGRRKPLSRQWCLWLVF